jgi:hypothetical protein
MTPETGFRSSSPERLLWTALIVATGLGLSTIFACATPFAALATVAALKLDGRSMIVSVGFVWLANQAIGYLLLGYPWTWNSAAWGLAIGAASGFAVLAAASLSTTRPARLAVSLPFMAAFATFELALYSAGHVLGGSDGAFSFAIVSHILIINAVTLCGLMAACNLALLAGRLARSGAGADVATEVPSFR